MFSSAGFFLVLIDPITSERPMFAPFLWSVIIPVAGYFYVNADSRGSDGGFLIQASDFVFRILVC